MAGEKEAPVLTGKDLEEQMKKEEAAKKEQAAKATPKVLANIVRGRMPITVVHMVRFGHKGEATKDLAHKFGTTIGKIDDIQKNRNFAYVTEDFKPTQEQKDEAIAYLKRHPEFNTGNVDPLINEAEKLTVATPEEAAKFAAVAKRANAQPATKSGEPIPAGGGNRKGQQNKKGAPAEAVPAGQAASAAELLK